MGADALSAVVTLVASCGGVRLLVVWCGSLPKDPWGLEPKPLNHPEDRVARAEEASAAKWGGA